jgi:hypothetical protein
MVLLGLVASVLVAQAPALPRTGSAMPFPPGKTETINIVNWTGADFPKVIERSEQLPLTDEELAKLAKAGFDPAQMVKMVEERRCACDVSADGLIKLKQAGVHKDVLAAISLHALKPNQRLTLAVTLDFTGESREAREAYLYFFVDDGPMTRVFNANLNDVLSGKTPNDTMVDKSDLLITKKVRRVQLFGQVPLKSYGKHNVMVVASANPTLTHPSQLTEAEKQNAQTYVFDYPRASLQSLCRLSAGYKRDAVLAYKWRYMGSRFECEWD